MMHAVVVNLFFFFNDTATTEIYTLSLHDALPICRAAGIAQHGRVRRAGSDHVDRHPTLGQFHRPGAGQADERRLGGRVLRSEEHTSELQSRQYLVCRLLLEKKKNIVSTVLSAS